MIIKTSHISDKDIRDLVEDIRDIDKLECECHSPGADLFESIKDSIERSDDSFVFTHHSIGDGSTKVLCIGGIVTMPGDPDGLPIGSPWMIGANALMDYPHHIAIEGRQIVDEWMKSYGTLYNFVHKDNLECHRWLKFCGFHIYDDAKSDPKVILSGEQFYQVDRVRA